MKVNYRPLHKSLTIKESSIDGLGLFAKEDIPSGENLGMSHLYFNASLIRTPLGGFYNHSENPNCLKILKNNPFKKWYDLITLEPIAKGEELTVEYTLYKIKK